MKTLKLIAAGLILFASSTIHAQVSVNVNIGTATAWAPVGYAESDYYYLPDVEAYYDVRATQFVYFGGGRWIRSRYLPNQYRNYDLYRGHKIVLNGYHGSRPYSHFNNHKVKHYKGYNGRDNRNVVYNNNRRVYVSNRNHDNYKDYKKYDKDRRKYEEKRYKKSHGNRHDRD